MLNKIKNIIYEIRKIFSKKKFYDEVQGKCELNKVKKCSFIKTPICKYPNCTILNDYKDGKYMNKVVIMSQKEFDEFCKSNGWSDSNVAKIHNMAFISIIGTKECLKYYLNEEETQHFFKKNHRNVLNLEFDDLTKDLNWKGHIFKAMTDKQAEKCIKFIEKNRGKTIYVHCRAGVSRSQAFFRFIVDFYEEYCEDCGRKDNPCLTPNAHVLTLLKRAYYKLNKIY